MRDRPVVPVSEKSAFVVETSPGLWGEFEQVAKIRDRQVV